ncbi:acyl-protein thioesterase 1 [Tothia fuscella]|uniref:Acyl-protein thioesterase 1 n=1 Tax=Tothia fuscella TaxID=1048955 RepID=A0A9P4NYJ4_9PEZI|nr:acyl-protein thioesterase 1 [Tothia fuscella]
MPPFIPGELVLKQASSPPSNPAHGAAIVFLHGFGDEPSNWASVADQFQAANKLPYLQWVIPAAPNNRDAMDTAWYIPSRLTPFPASRPELEDDEDEDGILQAKDYIVTLIDDLVAKGLPSNRIILAGFSQGHAMTLLTGLASKYADQLGGLVCLSGYMPLADKINNMRAMAGLPKPPATQVPMFIVRGKKDFLVPKRYMQMQLEKLEEIGVDLERVEVHEYDSLGHQVVPEELFALIKWLEKAVPVIEE